MLPAAGMAAAESPQPAGADIHHPTQPIDRESSALFFNEPEPHGFWLAKKAAVGSTGQRNIFGLRCSERTHDGTRTGCPALLHEQKAELWQRWKAGETLSDIGRALGKHAASVFGVVAAKGGFAPTPRLRKPGSLSLAEREEISRGLAEGRALSQIGRDLGRAASTISREVARNGGRRVYRAARAEERALNCALRPKPCRLAFNDALCRLVAGKLSGQWSPQQIAGWLKARYP